MSMTAEERKLLQEARDAAVAASKLVERHDKTLYGNGRPGLCTQVQNLQIHQQECPARKALENGSKSVRVATWGNVIAIAAVVVSLIISVCALIF